MYNIDFEIIAFETGLKINQIEDAIKILEGKVFYDREKEIIWVKNHVRHQFMRTANISPKIIEGISKCLISLNKHFFVGLFLKEYQELKIPYPYPIDTVSDRVSIYPSSEGEGEGEGKGESDGFSLKEKEDCKEEKENFLLIAKKIIDHLNQKTGKNFSPTNKKTVAFIKARFNEGRTPDDFIHVIDVKCAKWLSDPKMIDFLRPETLFGNKFENYLNELPAEKYSWTKELAERHSGIKEWLEIKTRQMEEKKKNDASGLIEFRGNNDDVG